MEARIMPSAVSCRCRGTDTLPASVVEPGQVYAFRNVILNPVAVPPFLRVNLDAIEQGISQSFLRAAELASPLASVLCSRRTWEIEKSSDRANFRQIQFRE